MNRTEAIEFLHKNKNYSRRLSAKLVDSVIQSKEETPFSSALSKALEKELAEGRRFVVIEKAKKKPEKGLGGSKVKGLVGWVGKVGFNECVSHLEGKKGVTNPEAVCGAMKGQARKTGKLAKKHMGRIEKKAKK